MSRLVLLALLFLVSSLAKGQQAPPPLSSGQTAELLTLDHAVKLALENNRTVKSAALEAAKDDDQRAATRTYRLPNFNLYAFGSQLLTPFDIQFKRGVFGTFSQIGPVPDTDKSIRTPRRPNLYLVGQVSQPLSQQYKIGLNLRLNALQRDVDREKFRAQQQEVANNVKRVYYAILQAQSALTATEEALKSYKELDRLVGEYVLQQVALKADSLDVKTRQANVEVNALALRHQLATLSEQLNDLLGRDIRTPLRVETVPEAALEEVNLEAAQARVLAARPEVRQALLKVEQAEYDRRLKKSEYIPDVSLSLHYFSPFNIEVLPKNVAALGLVVSWEPFDWGRRSHELAQKSKSLEQAKLALRETESRVLMDVDDKFRKLEEARAQLQVARLGQETARERLRVTLNKFSVQASLLKDTLQAQASLAEANSNYQQALLAFWTAKADLEKALGEN